MKKKYSKEKLMALEKDMHDDSFWTNSNHTVSYKGPTSIRFAPELLIKLQTLAKAKHKTIGRLVNDYVKAFVDEEYQLIQK